MKKNILISLVALGTAIAGVLIALAAYQCTKKKESEFEDFEDDFTFDDPDDIEYYSTHIQDDECCDCEDCNCGSDCEDCSCDEDSECAATDETDTAN